MKNLVISVVVTLSLVVVSAMADDNTGVAKKTSAIEITDVRGTKHIVMNCESDLGFGGGLVFDHLDDDFYSRAKLMKTLIAVELHTPEAQEKIFKVAVDRGMSPPVNESDESRCHTMLLIPPSSIKDITFTQEKIGDHIQTRSVICLAGGEPFDGGGGFTKLSGQENLGSLGTSDFSAYFTDIKEIRSLAPVPFVGDFAFFRSTEVPFSAKVTDTAGEVIVLKKALYCDTAESSKPIPGYLNTVRFISVRFQSNLGVVLGGVNHLSIPPSKLRTIRLINGKNSISWGRVDAKAILRTGENYDLTIVTYYPSGILGASSKGWIWIPWFAVASIEFEDK